PYTPHPTPFSLPWPRRLVAGDGGRRLRVVAPEQVIEDPGRRVLEAGFQEREDHQVAQLAAALSSEPPGHHLANRQTIRGPPGADRDPELSHLRGKIGAARLQERVHSVGVRFQTLPNRWVEAG